MHFLIDNQNFEAGRWWGMQARMLVQLWRGQIMAWMPYLGRILFLGSERYFILLCWKACFYFTERRQSAIYCLYLEGGSTFSKWSRSQDGSPGSKNSKLPEICPIIGQTVTLGRSFGAPFRKLRIRFCGGGRQIQEFLFISRYLSGLCQQQAELSLRFILSAWRGYPILPTLIRVQRVRVQKQQSNLAIPSNMGVMNRATGVNRSKLFLHQDISSCENSAQFFEEYFYAKYSIFYSFRLGGSMRMPVSSRVYLNAVILAYSTNYLEIYSSYFSQTPPGNTSEFQNDICGFLMSMRQLLLYSSDSPRGMMRLPDSLRGLSFVCILYKIISRICAFSSSPLSTPRGTQPFWR